MFYVCSHFITAPMYCQYQNKKKTLASASAPGDKKIGSLIFCSMLWHSPFSWRLFVSNLHFAALCSMHRCEPIVCHKKTNRSVNAAGIKLHKNVCAMEEANAAVIFPVSALECARALPEKESHEDRGRSWLEFRSFHETPLLID